MVSWATMVYLVSLVIFTFIYALLYDLFTGFYTVVLENGGNTDVLGVLYAIFIWMPVAFFISTTFWYIVMSQRRDYTT